MKKRSMFLMTFALALLLVVGGTMAWFTAEANVENRFTAGTLDIEVIEEFDAEAAGNVNPGDEFDKEVEVIVTGTKRAYIRVNLDAKWYQGEELVGEDLYPAELVGLNTDDWVLGEDGYYYYKHIVEPEGKTSKLFTGVIFNGEDMGNEYQGAKFNLNVSAEAIQVTNGAFQDEWGFDPASLGIEVLAE